MNLLNKQFFLNKFVSFLFSKISSKKLSLPRTDYAWTLMHKSKKKIQSELNCIINLYKKNFFNYIENEMIRQVFLPKINDPSPRMVARAAALFISRPNHKKDYKGRREIPIEELLVEFAGAEKKKDYDREIRT